MDISTIGIFIPTFFLVSITPGMCMTLAMTLGMSVGVKQTMWMMLGELLGVSLVATASVLTVSAIMLSYPIIFVTFKTLGGLYLAYLGISMWQSKGKLALASGDYNKSQIKPLTLFTQGLLTAVANPKGWAFMIALLPPFINKNNSMETQLIVLVCIILISEFICMMIYATGGQTIGRLLTQQNNVKLLNKLTGSLMILVALWLVLN